MSEYVQVGFLVTGAKTSADLSRALRAIARTLDEQGAAPIGKDYNVGDMSVQIRQR